MQKTINHVEDSHAIPFENAIEPLALLERGNVVRVMYQVLCLTGSRITALDNMEEEGLHFLGEDYMLYWDDGKQGNPRKEHLPSWIVEEIRLMQRRYRCYKGRLFPINAETFRRYFERSVRPRLTPAWNEVRPRSRRGALAYEYILQLKGLRKNFQTLEWMRNYKEYHDADIAMHRTSQKMSHSSTKITAYHYIENLQRIKAEKFSKFTIAEILRGVGEQKSLKEYS